MSQFLFAFMLTVIAGLSTVIGAFIVFFAKKSNTKFLAVSLGFSAGVMIYVSFMEILLKGKESLTEALGESNGMLVMLLSFFGGIAVIALIDKFLPDTHELKDVTKYHPKDHNNSESRAKLLRTGLFTALAVTIHNFPEGLMTFMAAMHDPQVAIPIVVAIAIHNIPEGIAVAAPVYYSTGSKLKAFVITALSGLSEPVGALIGYWLLMPFMSDMVYGIIFSSIAGVMVFISLDELLPSAREYGEHHLSIYGLVAGMAVMAISLWLLI
ncbi:MAG: zinc transporter ZupT [Streptococcaceae bacterium]|jgi:ZIP family zinc transporter|nr:zinc transporter ZupT [Streptococcaceae bacterium]